MNCQDLLKMLNEYVDGTIDPALCEALQKHLDTCNPCQVVIDNIRKTITLYRAGQPLELPAEVRERLYGMIRENWKGKHKGAEGAGS
jgi:anti-sigma factor RsiW